MKKTSLALGAAIVMMAGMLMGCGAPAGETTTAEAASAAFTAPAVSVEPASEAASVVTPAPHGEETELYVFIAASLRNTMEKIKEDYEADHPGVTIIYNADSSGTLQKQIEEGAECDIFFSAASKQMNALEDGGYLVEDSVTNLLVNQIVLIQPSGVETKVTGFDNITEASSLALAGEDVPVGQYARQLFANLGILDQVMAMEINEGANVTAVLAAVAEASNEVGIVYATDAASMPERVEIIAAAEESQVDPAVYPVGLVKNAEADEIQSKVAEDFKHYLTTDETPLTLFEEAGFTVAN